MVGGWGGKDVSVWMGVGVGGTIVFIGCANVWVGVGVGGPCVYWMCESNAFIFNLMKNAK